MTTATTTATRPATARRPWRLTGTARKWWLILHIVSAVGWLGADVALLVLSVRGFTAADQQTTAVAYQAMALFGAPVLLTAGVVCLASGVVLGLGSKYGLVRYWWVAIKLALNLVLTTLVIVLLRPGLDEAAAQARDGRGVAEMGQVAENMLFPPIVSLAVLTFATVLSVLKPWGRVRRGAA